MKTIVFLKDNIFVKKCADNYVKIELEDIFKYISKETFREYFPNVISVDNEYFLKGKLGQIKLAMTSKVNTTNKKEKK